MTLSSVARAFCLLIPLGVVTADWIWNITPEAGSVGALKYQPVLDWDDDTCYHTAAIDPSGNTNLGLHPSSSEAECRKRNRLDHCNAYAREKCNHGWCVYMYGYYTEMDWSPWSNHRHDWEHAMVWTRDGAVWSVMWSAHGEYNDADPSKVLWQGSHPKLVAHHGAGHTGSLRLAKSSDDKAENILGKWVACPLQQRGYLKNSIWNVLVGVDWGDAHMDLADGRFKEMLQKYMPDKAREDGFTAN
ncbi:necrosis inducing protein-domain-containing protein [Phaeosphaeria sp. MPI-PUGE-AT-0046c]|nr:necrosis inducing protein-domain-containing protein [Phaeosphaeria sp. MPI-PUGE-AT-0046c]